MQQNLPVDTAGVQAMASRWGISVDELIDDEATSATELAALAQPVVSV